MNEILNKEIPVNAEYKSICEAISQRVEELSAEYDNATSSNGIIEAISSSISEYIYDDVAESVCNNFSNAVIKNLVALLYDRCAELIADSLKNSITEDLRRIISEKIKYSNPKNLEELISISINEYKTNDLRTVLANIDCYKSNRYLKGTLYSALDDATDSIMNIVENEYLLRDNREIIKSCKYRIRDFIREQVAVLAFFLSDMTESTDRIIPQEQKAELLNKLIKEKDDIILSSDNNAFNIINNLPDRIYMYNKSSLILACKYIFL